MTNRGPAWRYGGGMSQAGSGWAPGLPPFIQKLLKERVMAAGQRRQGGLGPGSMPTNATRAKTGHHVHHWRLLGRQALVVRALHLGVLVKAKDAPSHAVGRVGKGQFRTWKSLAAAVQRAEADL